MKIDFVEIINFRKLRSCRVDFTDKETVFVGANNSGKTSAMDALILFLKARTQFTTREFTLSNWQAINDIGKEWLTVAENNLPDLSLSKWADLIPRLDVWMRVTEKELHYVSHLIPTLDWKDGLLGIGLRFEPKKPEDLYKAFITSYNKAKLAKAVEGVEPGARFETLKLWPRTMWDFLDRRLSSFFEVKAYILDPAKLANPESANAKPQKISEDAVPLDGLAFSGLIKVDIINAQRGFSDAASEMAAQKSAGNLSTQLRDYYTRHLDPNIQNTVQDLEALRAIEDAQISFDSKLSRSFGAPLKELESLNYPGFGGNPSISLSSRVSPIDGLSHPSAVQFRLLTPPSESLDCDYPLSLPEKYNGLGYQNLISMIFKLMRFRDEWMQVGKSPETIESDESEFEPLHLVLVEEPEAHLHAQVQQVFIRKAYSVLRNHDLLKDDRVFSTQLIVSTHSNHIAHEIDFRSLRYFKRNAAAAGSIPTSCVVNLSTTFGSGDETTKFAIRYLRTTHCDLFFADAVILIEGPAERMLVPHFIASHYPELSTCYISLLEIGGSHAHKLKPLLEDLGIITLVITDIDCETSGKSVCPEKGKGYKSGNYTLSHWIPAIESFDELVEARDEAKICSKFPVRVAYQYAHELPENPGSWHTTTVLPSTFEDALAFENLQLFRSLEGKGLVGKFKSATNSTTCEEAGRALYDALRSGNKAEFALELLFLKDPQELKVPQYIAEGLSWLSTQLMATRPLN